MSIKATINTTGKYRVSINKKPQYNVKTYNVPAVNKLSQLLDVDASNPNNNETLVYDAVSGKYVIKELPVINGGTF